MDVRRGDTWKLAEAIRSQSHRSRAATYRRSSPTIPEQGSGIAHEPAHPGGVYAAVSMYLTARRVDLESSAILQPVV